MDTETAYNKVGQNTGNLAFHMAIKQQLGGGLPSASWSDDIDKINSTGTLGVIPCANQLGPHLNLFNLAEKFRQVLHPLVAIGLGAQAGVRKSIPEIPKGTQNWLKAISERAISNNPNIGLRGPFTLEVLEHLNLASSATVIGCPSLFINPAKNLGQIIAKNLCEPKIIAVVSGHQKWTHLAKLEASLTNLVTITGGSYIGQSPLEMVKLTRGESQKMTDEELNSCRDFCCPQMDLDEFRSWSRSHGNVFFDAHAWMEFYKKYDFVIGARIHGVMLALQAGVPALCIAHDSRTLELCETMKIPHIEASEVYGGIARKEILKKFKFDPDEFDSNRTNLARNYSSFLKANELTPADWLDHL
jgi:hypothetical protein